MYKIITINVKQLKERVDEQGGTLIWNYLKKHNVSGRFYIFQQGPLNSVFNVYLTTSILVACSMDYAIMHPRYRVNFFHEDMLAIR